MNSIEIKNLEKKFKEKIAVDKINLSIKEGELFSLLGVNGAGKTTTIKMLCGLLKPTSGDATLLNESIVKSPLKVKKYINVSPQETAIAPNLTVRENLEFIAGIYGINKKETLSRTNKLLKQFKLLDISKSRTKTLSGGYKRRLSIAMALITEPKILFLDEPTLGLDVLVRRELWDIILSLKGKTTIILTTHYMEEAEVLSDKVAIMVNGKIIECDTPKNLVKKTTSKNFEDAFVKIAMRGENI